MEVIDDGDGMEAKAGDVDQRDWAAAGEGAEKRGFAGSGGAGDEDDLAGSKGGEMGQRANAAMAGRIDVEPLGDVGAVVQAVARPEIGGGGVL